MKELKIERAEHKRRIEQLEDQNDDLLLELASLYFGYFFQLRPLFYFWVWPHITLVKKILNF